MPAAFKLHRIICTLNDMAYVSGSDNQHLYPPEKYPAWAGRPQQSWYQRASWSRTDGVLWKTETPVRRHLHNFCHDWQYHWRPSAPDQEYRSWKTVVPGSADWSRLQFLVVEQILVTNYSTIKLPAHDFMGIPEQAAA